MTFEATNKSKLRWVFGIGLLVFFVGAIVSFQWFWRDFQSFAETPLTIGLSDTALDISEEMTYRDVVLEIRRSQVSRRAPFYWYVLAATIGMDDQVNPGEFDLPAGITPRQLLQNIIVKKYKIHNFLIVDGWTFTQLREALSRQKGLRQTLGSIPDTEIARLVGITDNQIEGWFLPQSYTLARGDSDVDLLRRAHLAMKLALDEMWKSRRPGLPFANQRQALVVASIIEASTAIVDVSIPKEVDDERVDIASPAAHDELGSAAKGDEQVHQRIIPELIENPIAFPGRSAFAETLQPDIGDSFYFVSTATDPSRLEFSAVFLALLDVVRERSATNKSN